MENYNNNSALCKGLTWTVQIFVTIDANVSYFRSLVVRNPRTSSPNPNYPRTREQIFILTDARRRARERMIRWWFCAKKPLSDANFGERAWRARDTCILRVRWRVAPRTCMYIRIHVWHVYTRLHLAFSRRKTNDGGSSWISRGTGLARAPRQKNSDKRARQNFVAGDKSCREKVRRNESARARARSRSCEFFDVIGFVRVDAK